MKGLSLAKLGVARHSEKKESPKREKAVCRKDRGGKAEG